MATPAAPADVERAWELYAKLDTLSPEADHAYQQILGQMLVGGVLARAELADSARSVLLKARATRTAESDPTQDLAAVEAYMRTHLGDLDEAIDLLKLYVAANPGHEFAAATGDVWMWRALRTPAAGRDAV